MSVTKLRISDDLALPLDAVTQKLAWLGRTGSGKTYGASKLAEEMIAAEAQVVVLDAVGVWYGLRLGADGKSGGIEIPVFGGLHGDVPLEPTGGALIANLIVDRGISCVVDVSQFEHDSAKARFAQDWADRFFFRKKAAPSAVHVFIEECQEFVPQNPQQGEQRMLHAFQRIEKLGRNFGIGVSLISQRPQEVNKKALNQTECIFAFQMTGPQERKALEGWVADKDLDVDVAAILPRLEVGQAHVWSPQWLRISKSIRISKKRTFNASTTPTVGQRAAERQLAPIDLARIRADMAATIERAKADDPKELRKQLAKARQEISDLRMSNDRKKELLAAPPTKEKRVEVPILKDTHLSRLEAALVRAEKILDKLRTSGGLLERVGKIEENARAAAQEISTAIGKAKAPAVPVRQPVDRSVNQPARLSTKLPSRTTSGQPIDWKPRANGNGTPPRAISGRSGDARMLQALAQFHPTRLTRSQLGTLAQVKPSGGSFDTYLSRLRSGALVTVDPDGIGLTAEGLNLAGLAPAMTSQDLISTWRSRLSGGALRMFDNLVEAYPGPLSREGLGVRAQISETGGSFDTYLSRLVSNGLAVKDRGQIWASETLFFGEGARL